MRNIIIKRANQKKSKKDIERMEDLMDVKIAYARKNEKKIPWETAKMLLREAGKL